jgi:hypothetical protein
MRKHSFKLDGRNVQFHEYEHRIQFENAYQRYTGSKDASGVGAHSCAFHLGRMDGYERFYVVRYPSGTTLITMAHEFVHIALFINRRSDHECWEGEYVPYLVSALMGEWIEWKGMPKPADDYFVDARKLNELYLPTGIAN